ncbi:MAG: cystatin domain-containing protein [Pyrinomonadaceae bacterium]
MRSNVRMAVVLAAFAAVLTFATASSAQIIVGGYKVVAKTDAGVVAAANFAVQAQSENTGREYELEDIVKAERQVVQGSNYRLCMEVSADGSDAFHVQAVVYVDLKGNKKLSSWADSSCGDSAAAPVTKQIVVGGFGTAPKTDAQVVAAANFAVKAQSKKLAAEFEVVEIVKAERQVVQGMNYRICMLVNVEGDEPFMISTVIYQDFKRNYSLSSWKESECGVAGASM